MHGKILLVEDDVDFGFMLKQYLGYADFDVNWINDPLLVQGDIAGLNQYDIIILDVMMPHISGFSLAKEIRSIYPELPLLFLTAKNQKIDKLTGLKIGADDYITKPCDPEELILRIRNIIRRSKQSSNHIQSIGIGLYTFYPQNLILSTTESQIQLTDRESKLLSFLLDHKDRLITREEILDNVWETNDFFTGRSMDVFISRLRKYLQQDPSLSIQSIRGIGFKVFF